MQLEIFRTKHLRIYETNLSNNTYAFQGLPDTILDLHTMETVFATSNTEATCIVGSKKADF